MLTKWLFNISGTKQKAAGKLKPRERSRKELDLSLYLDNTLDLPDLPQPDLNISASQFILLILIKTISKIYEFTIYKEVINNVINRKK